MNKEFNVFAGLLEDYAFLAITVVTILVQIFAVMFMGRPLRCTALDLNQQLYTIGMAFGILLWNPLMTVIFDPSCFGWATRCVPNKEASEEDKEGGIIALSGRASARKTNLEKVIGKKLDEHIKIHNENLTV